MSSSPGSLPPAIYLLLRSPLPPPPHPRAELLMVQSPPIPSNGVAQAPPGSDLRSRSTSDHDLDNCDDLQSQLDFSPMTRKVPSTADAVSRSRLQGQLHEGHTPPVLSPGRVHVFLSIVNTDRESLRTIRWRTLRDGCMMQISGL